MLGRVRHSRIAVPAVALAVVALAVAACTRQPAQVRRAPESLLSLAEFDALPKYPSSKPSSEIVQTKTRILRSYQVSGAAAQTIIDWYRRQLASRWNEIGVSPSNQTWIGIWQRVGRRLRITSASSPVVSGAGRDSAQFDIELIANVAVNVTPGAAGSRNTTVSASAFPDVVLTLAAKNVAFDPLRLTVPARVPFRIRFLNEDAGVQHNFSIYLKDAAKQQVFKGDIVTGIGEKVYTPPPLGNRAYLFRCDVHPEQMTGTITVQGG